MPGMALKYGGSEPDSAPQCTPGSATNGSPNNANRCQIMSRRMFHYSAAARKRETLQLGVCLPTFEHRGAIRPNQSQQGGVAIPHIVSAIACTARSNAPRYRAVRRLPWALALLCAALYARPASAQIALVQKSGLFGTTAGITTTSPAFGSQPTLGDEIVVLVWTWSENNPPSLQITDSAGNTYTQVTQGVIDQSAWFESAGVFYAHVGTTGHGLTLTINSPGNDGATQIEAVALEYSGLGAPDQYNSSTGSSAAASVATTAATSNGNELVVSVFGIDNPASCCNTIAASSGYAIEAVDYQNSGDTAGAGAQQILTTTGIQSTTFTVNPTLSGWAAAIATFLPANPSRALRTAAPRATPTRVPMPVWSRSRCSIPTRRP